MSETEKNAGNESGIKGLQTPSAEKRKYKEESLEIEVHSEVHTNKELNEFEVVWYAESSQHEGVTIEDTASEAVQALLDSISTNPTPSE